LWFPTYFEICKPDFMTGAARDLQHALLGVVRARVQDATWEATAECLGGVIVKATLVITNEDPSTEQFFGITTATGDPARLAAAAGTAAEAVGVTPAPGRPDAMLAAQYGVTTFPPSLSDIWAAISALTLALDIASLVALATLAGDVDVMIDSIRALDDATAYPALDACIAFRLYINTALASLAQANRPTKTTTVTQRTTLTEFAKRPDVRANNTLENIISLNPKLLKRPFIERAAVTYYAAAA
jgi:hypothetical protein